MIHRFGLGLVLSVVLVMMFQNCAGQGGSNGFDQVDIQCLPSDQPCLSYSLNLVNQPKSNNHGLLVELYGSSSEGVPNYTEVSSSCVKTGPSTALCPFDETISVTIQSTISGVGDGRSLKATFYSDSSITTKTMGTLYH